MEFSRATFPIVFPKGAIVLWMQEKYLETNELNKIKKFFPEDSWEWMYATYPPIDVCQQCFPDVFNVQAFSYKKNFPRPVLCGSRFGKWCSGCYLDVHIDFACLLLRTFYSAGSQSSPCEILQLNEYIDVFLYLFSKHCLLRWHNTLRKNLKPFHFTAKVQRENDNIKSSGKFRSLI